MHCLICWWYSMILKRDSLMTNPGWEICWSQVQYTFKPGSGFGEWTSNARLVMTGSMLPVACGPLHCLFGEWCSAVKCWPSWQQFHYPFGPMAGSCLDHTSQADWHPGGCRGRDGGRGDVTEERSCWLSTLVLGQACCQLYRRLPRLHHNLHVSVATGILVCTSTVNIIPSRSVWAWMAMLTKYHFFPLPYSFFLAADMLLVWLLLLQPSVWFNTIVCAATHLHICSTI